jgi:hypothetical protein
VEGNNILVAGSISTREGEKPTIKANDIFLLREAYKDIPCSLNLVVNELNLENDKIDGIETVLEKYPGNSEIFIHFQANGARITIKSKKYAVEASPDLLKELTARFGKGNIRLKSQKSFANGNRKGGY